MKVFKYSIFLSAFLLFQVQPMIARYILPWYGGSASVWSTCLLFFQAGLLLGYGYSHLITKYFSIKNQVIVHVALLVISFITLPVTPGEWLKPQDSSNPILGIIFLLTITVGFPYIMVSTTGPLLQYWFSISFPKKTPYGLYALSNFGSLLGLITYPILVEPYLNLKTQTLIWSAGYLLFAVFCGITAFSLWRQKETLQVSSVDKNAKVDRLKLVFWLLLSFMGTFMLLSITGKLTQDLVVVPFLWIIPLSLYLITFIIAFGKPEWYNRKIFFAAIIIILFVILKMELDWKFAQKDRPIMMMITWYCLAVFSICMILHGELARIKPKEDKLTLYYLLISVGGVLAGIVSNFIVPLLLRGYWEVYIGFAIFVPVIAWVILKNDPVLKSGSKRMMFRSAAVIVLLGVVFSSWKIYKSYNMNVIESSRNFYGVLRVTEEQKNNMNWYRTLAHGEIFHGGQFMLEQYQFLPIAYYGPYSGVGLALKYQSMNSDSTIRPKKVGVIGLGVGCIAVYGNEKDEFRYYEINPLVEDMARKYFTYLDKGKSKSSVVIGDGRTALERELKESGSNKFDVLMIDAFSGDNIPTHLLTMEAFELYLKHLNEDGIIAFNITNKFLNLFSVLQGLSTSSTVPLYFFQQVPDQSGATLAYWGVFTKNKKFLEDETIKKLKVNYTSQDNFVYWTDDFSSILPLFWSEEDFR